MKMLSVRALSVVVLLALTVRLHAQAADETLIAKLESTVVLAEWVAVDLEEVIDDLRKQHGLNIHVSWRLLDELGIRKDKRIEVRLEGVSLATVLDMVLREAEPDPGQIGYAVEGGVIVISTRRALTRNTVIKPYNVTDLIESGYAIRRFGNTPVLSLGLTGREFYGGETPREPERRGGGGGGGGGGGSIFGDPGSSGAVPSRMERLQKIIDLLTETVDSSAWDVNGGDVASIRAFNNVLFIRHTIAGHRGVQAFFDVLRRQEPAPLDGEVVIVRLRADKAAQWRRELAPKFPRLAAEDMRRLSAEGEAEGVLFRGTTSGFNGQAMWFSALTQRDVVTTLKAQTAEQINAFAPVTGFTTEGLELIILPLLCANGDAMLLDVQMAWVPGADVTAREVTLAGSDAKGSIDQTRRSMRTVSTKARVGAGEGLALTIPQQLDDAGRAAEYEDWLVLHVHRPPAATTGEAHAAR